MGGRELAQQVAIAAAWVIANPIKALVGLGLAAGVGMLVASQMSSVPKIKDGMIDPQGGLLVSGPEGSIQLDKKDSIVAGTNLGGGGNNQNNNSNELRELKNMVAAIANRPINVSIDGKKVIEATTGNQPNTVGDESRKNSYRIS